MLGTNPPGSGTPAEMFVPFEMYVRRFPYVNGRAVRLNVMPFSTWFRK